MSRLNYCVFLITSFPLKVHTNVSSNGRDLNCNVRLHQHPCFVYLSGEGSGKSALMRIFGSAVAQW